MEYTLNLNIKPEDYIAFNQENVLKNKKTKKFILIVIFIALFIPIVDILIGEGIAKAIEHIFLFIFLFGLYAILFFLIWPIRIKKIYKSDAYMQTEIQITITENGVSEVHKYGSQQFSKADIQNVLYGKKVIALYIALNKAIVIPRHCFKSPEEEKEIEDFIRINFSNK